MNALPRTIPFSTLYMFRFCSNSYCEVIAYGMHTEYIERFLIAFLNIKCNGVFQFFTKKIQVMSLDKLQCIRFNDSGPR